MTRKSKKSKKAKSSLGSKIKSAAKALGQRISSNASHVASRVSSVAKNVASRVAGSPTIRKIAGTVASAAFPRASSIARGVSNISRRPTQQSQQIDHSGFRGHGIPLAERQTSTRQSRSSRIPTLLEEQLRENPSFFDAMTSEDQDMYSQIAQQMEDWIEQGRVVNPEIEITEDQRRQFLEDAIRELDPSFEIEYGELEDTLNRFSSRLKQDYERGAQETQQQLGETLVAQDEDEAQAGLAFSSGRVQREKSIEDEAQKKVDELQEQSQRSAEDAFAGGEFELGSERIGQKVENPLLKRYKLRRPGIQQVGEARAFEPRGGVLGSIRGRRETATRLRASELEGNYRRRRLLDQGYFE